MKNFIFSAIALATLTSCGAAMRSHMGATEEDLVKTISIEKSCPIENIKILDKVRGAMSATYSVEACGEKYVYKQSPNMSGFQESK